MTEPILVESQQPGFKDELVALMYLEDASDANVLKPNGKFERINMGQLVFIFHNRETGEWVDRAWSICLPDKRAITTMYSAEQAGQWRHA